MKAITIKSARVIGPLMLEMTWSTGETLRANLDDGLRPPMTVLLDAVLFDQMQVDAWGHALEWPDGYDLGADTLYGLCRTQATLPTAQDFNDWMQRNGL